LTNVAGYDVTHSNLPTVPAGAQLAGYTTGTPDIRWTAADFAAHPGTVRICQDDGSDTTADVLDVERFAATNTDAATWYPRALAAYQAGTRPGQRLPCIYTSQANVTPLVNTLIAAGITAGPGLWVAHWGIGQAAAEDMLNASGGPFPTVGVQYQNGATYDYDVWLESWLTGTSVEPTPPPTPTVPAWQEAMMQALPVLAQGSSGQQVRDVQGLCNAHGHALVLDGIFGPRTAGAVRAVQSSAGIAVDGIVGPQTWPVLLDVA
jgi:hypothetical protein